MVVVDLFFPRFCLGCGFLGSYLCLSCESKLTPSKEVCLYCQKESRFGLTHQACQRKGGVDGFVSLYKYNDTFRSVLKKIKYKLVRESIRETFPLFFRVAVKSICFYKRTYKTISLQPVPLYPRKEMQRGFNQSRIISQYISRYFNMRTIDVVKRTVNNKPQADLSRPKERRLNMRGVFEFCSTSKITDSSVFIVDDVVTTGSTVKEVALVLKRHGVGRVFVFTLAKG